MNTFIYLALVGLGREAGGGGGHMLVDVGGGFLVVD